MRYGSILLLFLFVAPLAAQQNVYHRVIEWQAMVQESFDEDENTRAVQYLRFKGSVYPNMETLWPYFHELISIPGVSNQGIELVDVHYEQIPADQVRELRLVDSLSTIPVTQSSLVLERKKPSLSILVLPLRLNPITRQPERVTRFSYRLVPVNMQKSFAIQKPSSPPLHSVLSTGSWARFKVNKTGIYRISYSDIQAMGIPQPENVRIYGNGGKALPLTPGVPRPVDLQEIPFYMSKGSDGVFNAGDYIVFYAEGPVTWRYNAGDDFFNHALHGFTSEINYFVTSNPGGKQVASQSPPPPSSGAPITAFDEYLYHELEETSILETGRLWVGETFLDASTKNFNFQFTRRIGGSPAKLLVSVYNYSRNTASFQLSAGGQAIANISVPSAVPGSSYVPVASNRLWKGSYVPTGDNQTLELVYNKNNNPAAKGYLDFITINYRRELTYLGTPLLFRDSQSISEGSTRQFTISGANGNLVVWDVTDINNPIAMSTQLSGTTLSFSNTTSTLREYVVFDPSSSIPAPVLLPSAQANVQNQDLRGSQPTDIIIVVHPDFLSHANQLAQFHAEQSNLSALIVTNDQIYNEFSSGNPDVSAIRDFVKMFYDRASSEQEMPRYLTLFGDGSYDNRTPIIKSDPMPNTNYILTYQSEGSLQKTNSYVTDDFFGLLDDNEQLGTGLLDIGVGRIPVQTNNEADIVLNKIRNYHKQHTKGDWRSIISFVADDEDGLIHTTQADELAQYCKANYPEFHPYKIYLDAYPQLSTSRGERSPATNDAINNRVRQGTLILNFTGHGSPRGWTSEQIVNIETINAWDNYDKLPLVVTATCEFGRYDDYKFKSGGEAILLNSRGGGIALLTTSRVVFSYSNAILNQNFYKHVFQRDDQGQPLRVGDIIRRTKNSTLGINQLNFVLLGDPALQLAVPKIGVSTTLVNGKDASTFSDTISALQKVTISGIVTHRDGQKMENFNGTVIPVVYDKPTKVTTLGNKNTTPIQYDSQQNLIYRGRSKATNGEFSFTFIVPRDINYVHGNGKINYYAFNDQVDGAGNYQQLMVGGASTMISTDTRGPEIELYLNDTTFVPGGITNQTPRIYAIVRDESGINTVGSGIGHDITADLDGKTKQTLTLNEAYLANEGSYQEGKIEYQMSNLNKGEHTLRLKVWDVHNNSSEAFIDFVVMESSDLVIEHLFNYPNPFTTRTAFHFTHNQPNETLDVLLQVFTVSGKLVKTFETTLHSSGFRADPIEWDGLDDYGDRIGRGVYFYRLKVRTPAGKVVEKHEKLLILR